jgi:hypothetical protein
MLRSAADAASAAIDYSKGNIEDGVVDSPPSRGPLRTPISSPSPLKRVSSGGAGSFSPNQRMDGGTSRKLDLPTHKAPGYPRLEDIVPLTQDQLKTVLLMSADAELFHPLDEWVPPAPKYTQHRRTSSADTLFRLRIFRENRRSVDSNSTGTPKPYMTGVDASLPLLPPRGTRSLSTYGAPQYVRNPKRKDGGSRSLGLCGGPEPAIRLQHHSRREDIFKGLAKLKDIEAAKSNCTANTDA